MTSDERGAEFSKQWLGYDHPDRDKMAKLIAAEIREAVKEALEEAAEIAEFHRCAEQYEYCPPSIAIEILTLKEVRK